MQFFKMIPVKSINDLKEFKVSDTRSMYDSLKINELMVLVYLLRDMGPTPSGNYDIVVMYDEDECKYKDFYFAHRLSFELVCFEFFYEDETFIEYLQDKSVI